ncbi:MAG: hypothetical protein CM15mP74_35390 [Halieaceae bacterium]|nr:MAG: hypothetical protein CM15mP74_35390 [Halieaceae bacterium]
MLMLALAGATKDTRDAFSRLPVVQSPCALYGGNVLMGPARRSDVEEARKSSHG